MQRDTPLFTEEVLQKHVKFLKRHLLLLPASHQSTDVNLMAVVFYAFESLAALGQDIATDYQSNLKWMRSNYVSQKVTDEELSGFIGGPTMNIPDTITLSLPNTLFGLLTLVLMRDMEFFDKVLNKKTLGKFVSRCQLKENGAFVSVLDYKLGKASIIDSHDLRFCYIAVAILYTIGCRTEDDFKEYIDVDSLVEFILSQRSAFGGFGAFGEAHAGYTSCALSALKLLNKLDELSSLEKEKTLQWLIDRQVTREGCWEKQDISNEYYNEDDHGGFQGRENKSADTCYAFWCVNSISILYPNLKTMLQTEPVKDHLLNRTQNTLTGGFSKCYKEDADLYHTCLGIAALKLMEGSFNGALCIPTHAAKEFDL
ncbi:hypothetical protein C6P45_000490 [Maudiozyma exigua]|uniref:Prenyltransferase alpha-alpha toroid domain-containing protein n=1 Tax=Maudiozyma exigua TaxID=34358 RepID=A0A9P7B974_MAUEX|nr:hypothetical protein C6P45_000490 [Kazachstania exigua]